MQRDPAPVLLPTRVVEKPWGMDRLPAPFAPAPGKRVGEIWFEPPAELPEILVKYLFVQEKLSIQVHPSDVQARRAGLGSHGKDECWVVIGAEPEARMGIGFRRPADAATMRVAARDGSIEDMLDWQQVGAGDVRYLPAGTVHAVGGGVCILEIQQNSDISFRFYDYGRPRQVHIDRAAAIACGEPHDPAHRFHRPQVSARLVSGPAFVVDQWVGQKPPPATSPMLVIPLEGEVTIAGHTVAPGQCALARSASEIAAGPGAHYLTTAPVTSPASAASASP